MKVCNKCLILKSFNDFGKRNSSKDGYRNYCKKCKANQDSQGRLKRLSSESAKEKERQRLRDIRSNETQEQYEIRLTKGRDYAKSNPDILLRNTRKRQARLIQATPRWSEDEFEQFYIEEIYHLSALRKQLLNTDFNVDHIVPLRSEFVCGLHCMSNLRILPAKTNKQKLNLHWPDMW